jgi:hypothetical protein
VPTTSLGSGSRAQALPGRPPANDPRAAGRSRVFSPRAGWRGYRAMLSRFIAGPWSAGRVSSSGSCAALATALPGSSPAPVGDGAATRPGSPSAIDAPLVPGACAPSREYSSAQRSTGLPRFGPTFRVAFRTFGGTREVGISDWRHLRPWRLSCSCPCSSKALPS